MKDNKNGFGTNCPLCGGSTIVIASQSSKTEEYQDAKIRRRKCNECGYRFSTIEITLDYYKECRQNLPGIAKLMAIAKRFEVLAERLEMALDRSK